MLGEGAVYRFSRVEDDKIVYCNVEGVAWLSPAQVVVSDKTKSASRKARRRSKDQSIHVFAIPE